jgi:predicted DNA-binding transcriptional regulator AlpA
MKRLICGKAVRAKTGLGKTKHYELIRDGLFPAPTKLPTITGKPGRTSYWPEEVIDAWIEAQVKKSLEQALTTYRNDPFGRTAQPAA